MSAHVFDIALTVPFRGITRRSGVLFEGPAGWAEWSPFPEYDDDEAAACLRAAREVAEVGLPAPVRDAVEVNGIVPALAPKEAAARAVESCDLFLSVGTSSVVYPAAGFIQAAAHRGATTVEINPEPTPISGLVDYSVRARSGEWLPLLLA